MAGQRSTQNMQSQNFSFVVTGDAAQIWAHWSRIPVEQIAKDLDRGGALQGPVFEGHPTSGANLLAYELPQGTTLACTQVGFPLLRSFNLPEGTTLACTQVGFPLLRSFINVPLNLMLIQNEGPSSLITEMEFKRDDEESSAGTLIFREKLSQVRALNDETAEECGHISGFIETEIRFNQNLHPEGQLRTQVFATMNSSMTSADLRLKLTNPQSYERILGTFSGLPLSLSALFINEQLVPLRRESLALEARLESKGADDDLGNDGVGAAGEGDSLLGEAFPRTVEVRMDFSINASSVHELWMTHDDASVEQGRKDEERMGARYLNKNTQNFAEGFMHQGRAVAIIPPDTLNNISRAGLGFLIRDVGHGARDFFVSSQRDQSCYISTRAWSESDPSPKSLHISDEDGNILGYVKLARGYMRIPGPGGSLSDNKVTWGYRLVMSVNDSFNLEATDKFLRKNLEKIYFQLFGDFLHKPTLFNKRAGFKVSSASVASINPQALVPMTLRAAAPVPVPAAPLVPRHKWGEYDEPVPEVLPGVSSNVLSRRNSLEVAVVANQSPMVPRGSVPSEKVKVSFAKGAAIAAAFLLVFVIIAAATHGAGVAPMLWAGVTLMTSLTGGAIGSAGILGFLGLGGGIGAGVRAKLNSRREALALARPNAGGDRHSTQSEGSSSPIPRSSGLVPRSRTGSLEEGGPKQD